MRKQALTAAMQAFAAIDLRDAVYVACPVSSGRRELDLMARLSLFDRDELRERHASQWRSEVLKPNKLAATRAVMAARDRHHGCSVINPAEFDLDGLTQDDYDVLCADIIRHHVRYFVLADGWQFSRGARLEAGLALELGLEIEDQQGIALMPGTVSGSMTQAITDLVGAGFPPELVGKMLPQFTTAG